MQDREPTVDEFAKAMWEVPMADFTETMNVNISVSPVLHIFPLDISAISSTPSSLLFSHPPLTPSQGVWFTSLAFLPLLSAGNEKGNMPAQNSQIIATSSIASFTRRPFAGYAYSASKAGVTHLVKNMATNFTPFKIRCNVLAPGLYPSEMTRPDGWAAGDETVGPSKIPEGRSGSKEDIAGTMLYLCSRAGAYCNGMVAVTDGGRMSIIPATY